MYVITGATGHVGSAVTEKLLAADQKLRLIVRDPAKLKFSGTEVATGSLDDVPFLTEAFGGARAVLTMIPADPRTENLAKHQDRIGEAIFTALQQSGVRHIVNISSMGGELESGTGPIAGLHRQEERLNKLEANVLHLRPTYFMENHLVNIPMIKNMGINGSPLLPDLKIPMIATADIGEFAARALLNPDFEGKSVRLLLGQRDVSMAETTRILGSAIGKPDLPYIPFSYEDAEKGMIASGLSPDVARSYVQMGRAFNEGLLKWTRTKENTTPTSIEEFAKHFASVFI